MKYLQFMMLIFQVTFAEDWVEKAGKKPGIEIWKITKNYHERKEINRSDWEYEYPDGKSYIVLRTEERRTEGRRTGIFRASGEVELSHIIFYFNEQNKTESILETKQKTVDDVSDLWHELISRTKNEVSITRWEYDSSIVQKLQPILECVEIKQEYIVVNRLYEVMFSGQFIRIAQVPQTNIKAHNNHTFVIAEGFSLQTIAFGNESDKLYNIACKLKRFIDENKLSRVSERTFWQINSSGITHLGTKEEKLPREQQDIIKLFQYDKNKMEVRRLTNLSLLQTRVLKPEHCYVLVKEDVKEAFIYLGKNSNQTEVKAILRYGEQLAHNKYLVTVVQNQNPPLPFIITFVDIMELFINEVDDKTIKKIISDKFTFNINNYYCHNHKKYHIKPT